MKGIVLAHYFLGLMVWQRLGEAFLGQGKYAFEILKRFQMTGCKPMVTPIIPNLRLSANSYSGLVDPFMYRQLIGSFMYLGNTKPDIYFAMNTLRQYMVDPGQINYVVAKHVL
jgi:hypothetical protein